MEKVEEISSICLDIPVMTPLQHSFANKNLDTFLRLKIDILEKLGGRQDEVKDTQLQCFIVLKRQWQENRNDCKVWNEMSQLRL